MPEVSIHLRRDPVAGLTVIRVGLDPDDDLLPAEHEQAHRRVVERLVPGLGRVTVERERPAREPVVG
jgi:hypothetical protein